MTYRIVADLVVVFHAGYVAFVVVGFALILLGAALRWEWIRNFRFRMLHLAAIGLVVVEAIVGVVCPLTVVENRLRELAGEASYPGDFIGYWAHALIFYNAPRWAFTALYTLFGACVVIAFVLAPPQRNS